MLLLVAYVHGCLVGQTEGLLEMATTHLPELRCVASRVGDGLISKLVSLLSRTVDVRIAHVRRYTHTLVTRLPIRRVVCPSLQVDFKCNCVAGIFDVRAGSIVGGLAAVLAACIYVLTAACC